MFTVTGGGRFPLSMLRFDEAFPATDEDAAKIEATFDGHVRRWEITLRSNARFAPTVGRWESFNIEVSPVF
jgi:hypothetical protein